MDHKRYSHTITYSNVMQEMASYKGFANVTLDCTLDAHRVGVILITNTGNVVRKFRSIVTAQTAHLNGILRISVYFP